MSLSFSSRDPAWLKFLSKHIRWIEVPNIAILFVTLQALGFLLIMADPVWFERLALVPELVVRGEIWRLLTFLALPLSFSPIWMIFSLWFVYYILNALESEWGSFKTTLYVLTSIFITILFSFVFGFAVTNVTDFVSTLFLAMATLFPEQEMRLYLVIPVKMKYMGWLAIGFVVLRLFQGTWLDRLFILSIYSNYLIFFGPEAVWRFKDWKRRRDYRAKLR